MPRSPGLLNRVTMMILQRHPSGHSGFISVASSCSDVIVLIWSSDLREFVMFCLQSIVTSRFAVDLEKHLYWWLCLVCLVDVLPIPLQLLMILNVQERCTSFHQPLTLGSTFLEKAAWHMLLKNHGFRTKQSVITSCLVLHTMKFDTRKVGNIFVSTLVLSPKPNLSSHPPMRSWTWPGAFRCWRYDRSWRKGTYTEVSHLVTRLLGRLLIFWCQRRTEGQIPRSTFTNLVFILW